MPENQEAAKSPVVEAGEALYKVVRDLCDEFGPDDLEYADADTGWMEAWQAMREWKRTTSGPAASEVSS